MNKKLPRHSLPWLVLASVLGWLNLSTAHAAGDLLWMNSYDHAYAGDLANGIAVDRQGNVFVTGISDNFFAPNSSSSFATVAYSPGGGLLWAKRYSTGIGRDHASAIAVDSNGNVFVTGATYGYGSSPTITTVAYSAAGVQRWVQFSSSGYANAIAVDSRGNVFVTGQLKVGSSYDFWTVAYSGEGARLWGNRYNGTGNGSDTAWAIAVDSSGNVFVTGPSKYGVGDEFATIAYSGAGVPLWTNTFRDSGSPYNVARAIATDTSGSVFVAGFSAGRFATVAYSGAGLPLWTNFYSGPQAGDDAWAIAVDGGGNVFVAGISYGVEENWDYVTIGYSSAGVPLWTNRYNGPGNYDDYVSAIGVDHQGNVFVTGTSDGEFGYTDYATIAYSGAGVHLWTRRCRDTGDSPEYASALAVDGTGNVVVTGVGYNPANQSSDYLTVKYGATPSPVSSPTLSRPTRLPNGSCQLGFTNLPGYSFTALASTNASLPSSNWTVLGPVPEIAPGQFQFTDPAATNFPARLYRVRSP